MRTLTSILVALALVACHADEADTSSSSCACENAGPVVLDIMPEDWPTGETFATFDLERVPSGIGILWCVADNDGAETCTNEYTGNWHTSGSTITLTVDGGAGFPSKGHLLVSYW